MYKHLKTALFASALGVGIAAAPALYAHSFQDTSSRQGAEMGRDYMPGYGHMWGQGDMPGYGNMMGQGHMWDQGYVPGRGYTRDQFDHMMEGHFDMMQGMMGAHGPWQSDDD